jgi:glycosyltransferase involved in cell wall biosynthesis
VCFIGGTRYTCPLSPTQAKKFEGLARDHDIRVVAFSSGVLPQYFVEHARFYLLPHVPVRALRGALVLSAVPVLVVWLVMRHGVNIVVAQSPYEALAGVWAKWLARAVIRRNVALIVESHGDFENAAFLHGIERRTPLRVAFRRAAARVALTHADCLRAISAATRNQLRRLGATQPLVEFPTWSDIEVFRSAGTARVSAGTGALYVGSLTPLKGLDHLIAAFSPVCRRVPSARLTLIGNALDVRYKRELERQIADLGLHDAVAIEPPLPQAELAQRMAHARLLVLPSLSEGLGRVVFEAMATGTPVVGSEVGGIPELIEDGVTGYLVAPGNEAQLAERIVALLEDPELSLRLGTAGRQFATSAFSSERYFRGYRQLFDLGAERVRDRPGPPGVERVAERGPLDHAGE